MAARTAGAAGAAEAREPYARLAGRARRGAGGGTGRAHPFVSPARGAGALRPPCPPSPRVTWPVPAGRVHRTRSAGGPGGLQPAPGCLLGPSGKERAPRGSPAGFCPRRRGQLARGSWRRGGPAHGLPARPRPARVVEPGLHFPCAAGGPPFPRTPAPPALLFSRYVLRWCVSTAARAGRGRPSGRGCSRDSALSGAGAPAPRTDGRQARGERRGARGPRGQIPAAAPAGGRPPGARPLWPVCLGGWQEYLPRCGQELWPFLCPAQIYSAPTALGLWAPRDRDGPNPRGSSRAHDRGKEGHDC